MTKPTFSFAVWRTQHGGLVRSRGDDFVFVEMPDCLRFEIGDVMPEEWDITPANDQAIIFGQSDLHYEKGGMTPDFN